MTKTVIGGRSLAVAVAAVVASLGLVGVYGQEVAAARKGEAQVAVTVNKFHCNIAALTPEERVRHHELTEKLKKFRKQVIETEKGYEYQYSPADVSVAEVGEWVVAESKCCPFFDFHIDLENEGKLVCLRLTGEEGVKAFIRGEFGGEKK